MFQAAQSMLKHISLYTIFSYTVSSTALHIYSYCVLNSRQNTWPYKVWAKWRFQQEKSLPGYHQQKTSAMQLSSRCAHNFRYFQYKKHSSPSFFEVKLNDMRPGDGLAQKITFKLWKSTFQSHNHHLPSVTEPIFHHNVGCPLGFSTGVRRLVASLAWIGMISLVEIQNTGNGLASDRDFVLEQIFTVLQDTLGLSLFVHIYHDCGII